MTLTDPTLRLSEADFALIQKYDRPGPRYTSYPPANHFTEAAPVETLVADCHSTNPLSLYFHIPFCEQLCWFCGCHMTTSLNHDLGAQYVETLIEEMAVTARHTDLARPVVQIHLGGGTPNFLTPEQIDRFSTALREQFTIADDAEISVELDPRHLTPEHVAALRRLGVNRASFGVQDCNEDVQRAIHRVQPVEMNLKAMAMLREGGVASINVDLMYGLPLQTLPKFAWTLEQVLAMEPDRFAVFNYAHVPWMKPQQKILERHPLPKGEEKLRLLKLIIETLTGAGFHYIGMDHFARAEDELVRAQQEGTLQRNFQGYSTRGGADIFAFGVSGISQTPVTYRQNLKTLPEYRAAIADDRLPVLRGYVLTDEDRLRRAVIMQLMCNLSLDFTAFSAGGPLEAAGIPAPADFCSAFAAELALLEPMAHDGLLSLSAEGIRINELGRVFIRNIAMVFDAHLSNAENRYSRTV